MIDAPLTDLILIRHGQSLANINASNEPDCALSPRGMQQARDLADQLMAMPIRGFIGLVSPYRRAVQTAQLIANRTGIDFIEDDGLREYGPPCDIAGRRFEQESPNELSARLKAFLHRVGGKVIVVSHGSPIAILAQLANGFEPRIDGPFHAGIGNAQFRWISDPTPFAAYR